MPEQLQHTGTEVDLIGENRREPHRKTIERKRRKDVHSVASDFVSDIPCGAPDVSDTWAAFDGEDELIRRGRKGREKRKARRMAITGVGRSWWGKRSISLDGRVGEVGNTLL